MKNLKELEALLALAGGANALGGGMQDIAQLAAIGQQDTNNMFRADELAMRQAEQEAMNQYRNAQLGLSERGQQLQRDQFGFAQEQHGDLMGSKERDFGLRERGLDLQEARDRINAQIQQLLGASYRANTETTEMINESLRRGTGGQAAAESQGEGVPAPDWMTSPEFIENLPAIREYLLQQMMQQGGQ